MKITGVEGMTLGEFEMQVQAGGKFVIFQYCISVIVLTFRRSSDIYFVKAGENAVNKGIGFTLLSLVLGWWGIPWGPIYTIAALVNNFKGGKDVTSEVMGSLRQRSV